MAANDIETLKKGIKESFSKIKDNFDSVNEKIEERDNKLDILVKEINELKALSTKLLKENIELKNRLSKTNGAKNDYESIINRAVECTMQKIKTKNSRLKEEFIRKFEKKRKDMIRQKIVELANTQELTIPEIKERVVDKEEFCSKATFYRYIEKMQNRKEIGFLEINERKILINKK